MDRLETWMSGWMRPTMASEMYIPRMITCLTRTSLNGRPSWSVNTPLSLSNESVPSTAWPKTACLPSRVNVVTSGDEKLAAASSLLAFECRCNSHRHSTLVGMFQSRDNLWGEVSWYGRSRFGRGCRSDIRPDRLTTCP